MPGSVCSLNLSFQKLVNQSVRDSWNSCPYTICLALYSSFCEVSNHFLISENFDFKNADFTYSKLSIIFMELFWIHGLVVSLSLVNNFVKLYIYSHFSTLAEYKEKTVLSKKFQRQFYDTIYGKAHFSISLVPSFSRCLRILFSNYSIENNFQGFLSLIL